MAKSTTFMYSIEINLSSHRFDLLADCGLYWPGQETLFIADTHFGKEATFRRGGIPVPAGSTNATLKKISGMIRYCKAKRLTILGDMFHSRSSLSTDVRQSIESFFQQMATVTITLVRGNHDAHVGRLPDDWPIEVIDAGTTIERVALGHHPTPVPSSADVYLCGHIHPAVRVGSRKESLGKMPCFWHSRGCMVLPAIGQFTGTHVVEMTRESDVWIVADGEVHQWSRAPDAGSSSRDTTL